VPTNESIQALQDAGKLSSWEKVDQFEESGNLTAKTRDSLEIVNFLKYHIQDNALYIGAQPESGNFETSLINNRTRRFFMLNTQLTDSGIDVEDATGTVHHVTKKTDAIGRELYNIQAREYVYESKDAATATNLYTTSSAVIHLIDSPLSYGN
jgi:hypothetical protein